MSDGISRLTPDDWQRLKNIRFRMMDEQPLAFGRSKNDEKELTEEDWRNRLSESMYLVQDDAGQIAGIINARKEKGEKFQHIALLHSVYVEPEYRGRGIGKRLVDAAIERLVTDPELVKIRLYVTVTQDAAVKLYNNVGFKKVGLYKKEVHWKGKYYDVISMEKFIR